MADVGNPTGLVTTPRDIACMGQLVLDAGKAADGTRVPSRQLIVVRTGQAVPDRDFNQSRSGCA